MLARTSFALRRVTVSPAIRPAIYRPFSQSIARRQDAKTGTGAETGLKSKSFSEIKTKEDLLPPGSAPGTVPTDMEQATGMERLEILGKMEGVDVFDMSPMDTSRKGTLDNPIMVNSAGAEQYVGCTGHPADSHEVIWLILSRDRPMGRCIECGNCIKMEYIGVPDVHDDHGHGHDHHGYEEPKTMEYYVKPEYH